MLREIIARLEKATGPDREIDDLIFSVINGRKRHVSTFEQYDPSEKLPAYTASMDAALTLLRKHYLWQVKQGIGCTAIVWWIEADWDDTGAPTGYSTTFPALALTTAALIARAVEDRAVSLYTAAVGDRTDVPTSGDPS